MGELRRWAGWAVAAVAVVIVIVALFPGGSEPVGNEARADALASNLRCPFCAGESIADAPSQTARDLRQFIGEKVDEGWSDEQVYAFFEARYGEQVRLDPPLGGWGAALWAVPLAVVGVGIVAIANRRRQRPDAPTESVTTPAEPDTGPGDVS